MNNQTARPLGLASLFRGMYNRAARELGVNASYVSRVARGQRRSDAAQAAPRRRTGRKEEPPLLGQGSLLRAAEGHQQPVASLRPEPKRRASALCQVQSQGS